jgi:hypothetical protein
MAMAPNINAQPAVTIDTRKALLSLHELFSFTIRSMWDRIGIAQEQGVNPA